MKQLLIQFNNYYSISIFYSQTIFGMYSTGFVVSPIWNTTMFFVLIYVFFPI